MLGTSPTDHYFNFKLHIIKVTMVLELGPVLNTVWFSVFVVLIFIIISEDVLGVYNLIRIRKTVENIVFLIYKWGFKCLGMVAYEDVIYIALFNFFFGRLLIYF